jgi:hypothetical protein
MVAHVEDCYYYVFGEIDCNEYEYGDICYYIIEQAYKDLRNKRKLRELSNMLYDLANALDELLECFKQHRYY